MFRRFVRIGQLNCIKRFFSGSSSSRHHFYILFVRNPLFCGKKLGLRNMSDRSAPAPTSTAHNVVNIKQRLRESLSNTSVSVDTLEKTWQSVERHYQESQRSYHTLTHISALLDLAQQYRHRIKDNAAVDLAILFHDIIYDPKSKTNEEDSAALFRELLSAHLPASLCDKVCHYIIETKKHAVSGSEDHDLKLFIDFDMSILGADREEYAAYARQIRYEYAFVPVEDYCKGRAAVLRSFLADCNSAPTAAPTGVAVASTAAGADSADSGNGISVDSSKHCSSSGGASGGSFIFATEEFRALLEEKARGNIAWECEVLSSGRLV